MHRQALVPETRGSRALTGLAAFLLVLTVIETTRSVVSGSVFDAAYLVIVATTLPFILIVGYTGYWLDASDVTPDRHRRILYWVFGGLVAFVAINVAIMSIFPRQTMDTYQGWVRWAAALGSGSGALIGLFEAKAINRELAAERERVRNEQLTARNARLEEFARILSHDLRSPLNVATGSIALASDDGDMASLQTAESALRRMDTIIDETLTLARSGLVIGDPEPVDIETLVGHCWGAVDTADATLTVRDVTPVTADPDRLRHLFENLFRNSVDHAGTDVTIEVGPLDDATGFYVADDGPGIDPVDREEVFEVGYTTAADGTGFGLAIVKQIADAHGWESTVTSSSMGGARFEFRAVESVTGTT